ncbi:ABC transporter substrate-binding protein [Thermovirga sp.]|uniref:ABC transporter substrate-binding protein n=1 Tax=Thermovirga sp. TaxID=2699834 RepID=UPI0025FE0150|nr:helical backbone metal receptor [Thermovirga sp.]MBO8153383.1 ABC transporter substrate-binding protein [Thermovirga sp.]
MRRVITNKTTLILVLCSFMLFKDLLFPVSSVGGESAVKRVVSLAPSITESLEVMGFASKVVGVTKYDSFRSTCERKIAVVGGFSTPSLEKIVSLQPDLVIGISTFHHKILKKLDNFGIHTLEIEPHRRLSEVEVSFYKIGEALDSIQQAKENWNSITRHLDDVKAMVRNTFPGGSPSVLIVVWHDPLTVAGGYNYIDDILDLIGVPNAAGNIKFTFPTIDREKLLLLNPDVILIASAKTGMSIDVDDFLNVFGDLPLEAIKKKRVTFVKSDLLFHPGPKIPETALLVVKSLSSLYGKKVEMCVEGQKLLQK